MMIDTHAHYDDEAFNEDRDDLISSLPENGIEAVVNIGASMDSTRRTVELVKQYAHVYGAIGVHPSVTAEMTEDFLDYLVEQSKLPKIVAIGEIGLDYYWDTPEREVQKYWFKKQLYLAIDLEMPVVIHSRNAAEDTLTMMKEAYAYAKVKNKSFTGVIHCFSYGPEIAKEYIKLGFCIAVGGVITFKNAKKLREVVEEIPLDKLVVETDCPYLSPEPNRGKRNSSLNLPFIIEKIALIKGISNAQVVDITSANAKKLYNLSDLKNN